MIKTIIIEDEARSREILHSMLLDHFNDVEVLAVCSNTEEGKAAIEDNAAAGITRHRALYDP